MTAPVADSRLVLVDGVLVEAAGSADSGAAVVIGLSPDAADEDELVGGLGRKVADHAQGLTDTIRTFCGSVQNSISDLACTEITVEFGVALKAGVDIPYLVTGTSEATVKVIAKWTTPNS